MKPLFFILSIMLLGAAIATAITINFPAPERVSIHQVK